MPEAETLIGLAEAQLATGRAPAAHGTLRRLRALLDELDPADAATLRGRLDDLDKLNASATDADG
jgi:hypothetical protein